MRQYVEEEDGIIYDHVLSNLQNDLEIQGSR